MGYSAKAVANYFLSQYRSHGITPLKIQKLVYLAHGWHMAYFDDPLVSDEWAEAWQYGPVFPSLYHDFKHRGRLPIIDLAKDLDPDLKETTPVIDKSDERIRKLLDRVWEVYGKSTGIELSEICHVPESPWDTARKEFGTRINAHIEDDVIREYYKALKERNSSRDQ